MIFVVGLLLNSGMFMLNTLVPVYTDSLGASPAVVGMVTSVFAVAALAIRPVSGPAMDYFDKRKMLSLLQFLLVVTLIGYALSNSIPTVIMARVLHGVTCGTAVPLILAMASNSNAIGMDVGLLVGGSLMGIIISTLQGITDNAVLSYSVAFYCMMIPAVSVLVVFLLTRKKLMQRLAMVTKK